MNVLDQQSTHPSQLENFATRDEIETYVSRIATFLQGFADDSEPIANEFGPINCEIDVADKPSKKNNAYKLPQAIRVLIEELPK